MADRTWVWLQPSGELGESNAGLVEGDGEALLIDTLWDERLTEKMLGSLPTSVPITRAVNTHNDGDHWWGNARLPAETRIMSTETALREMRADSPPWQLALLRSVSAVGSRIPGRIGRTSERLSEQFGPFAFGDVQLRYPEETFVGEYEGVIGGRAYRARDLGPAHTASDVIVQVPDAGVVFTGDLLFIGVTPIMWHGPIANWIAALDFLLDLEANAYVPGHGPIATAADVAALRDYWRWVSAAAAEQLRAEVSPYDAAERLIGSAEFDPWREWLAPERLVVNLAAVFLELQGRKPIGKTMRLPYIWQMGTLRTRLAARATVRD